MCPMELSWNVPATWETKTTKKQKQKTNISTWTSYKNIFQATKQVAIVILQWENKIKWSDAP